MKRLILLFVLMLSFIGCSTDDSQTTQVTERVFVTKSNESIDPKIEKEIIQGSYYMDEHGTTTYGSMRRLCGKNFAKQSDGTYASGSYEELGGVVFKVTKTYAISGGKLTEGVTVEIASPLWDCNDLPGGIFI